METGLAGQGVLVTGASGGIGAACARAFAAEGARVLVHYNQGEERARALSAELGGAPIARADLTQERGADGLLDRTQVEEVAQYVLSLTDRQTDAAAAERGAIIYADNCASCHGESGEGNHEMGAPALMDAIWLYGGDLDQIVAQIDRPRMGVMPAWQGRLDDTTIKMLAVYVYSLGGGE